MFLNIEGEEWITACRCFICSSSNRTSWKISFNFLKLLADKIDITFGALEATNHPNETTRNAICHWVFSDVSSLSAGHCLLFLKVTVWFIWQYFSPLRFSLVFRVFCLDQNYKSNCSLLPSLHVLSRLYQCCVTVAHPQTFPVFE